MTTGGGFRGYRWRRISPEQGEAIREQLARGATALDLARQYGVHVRTIYRAAERAATDVVAQARVDGWKATYALTAEGPVQLTHWVPFDQEQGS